MAYNDFVLSHLCDSKKKAKVLLRQTSLPEHCKKILDILSKNENATIFLTKVNKRDAPNYYDIIKHPMDLGTVGKRIPLYRSMNDFKRDLDLIWDNCVAYNSVQYYINLANNMRKLANSLIYNSNLVNAKADMCDINGMKDRKLLKKAIAKYLALSNFTKCSLDLLEKLSEITEIYICNIIKNKFKTDESSQNK